VNELIQFDLNFASFNAPYNPVRLMCDKRPANIQCLILRLITRYALWSEKYGNGYELCFRFSVRISPCRLGFCFFSFGFPFLFFFFTFFQAYILRLRVCDRLG